MKKILITLAMVAMFTSCDKSELETIVKEREEVADIKPRWPVRDENDLRSHMNFKDYDNEKN